MRYKAKVFKSHLRKMTNGKNEYFIIKHKPSSFDLKILKNKKRG